ncbi:antibiotic biosynthesis monooxygenase family protein [Pantoea allii]|uniref:antibiotic biosynthesis monooxygenase family protein n=1 Tax=Pantoea TaxID=53335 RepID=UPI0007C7F5A9|nr:antibiotic biosynthesis monooxygenase [Pantoea sp. OXWO6B1]OAE09862.1 antibiotic biosynthesis monooxygenase [Pantoea sp. OXWO6B1]
MIAVLFEAEALPAAQQRYLALAAELTPALAEIPGFIRIERFQSLSAPGKVLSLSWWEDESAVRNWRENTRHQSAQAEGKKRIFAHYQIRVVQLIRDYSGPEGRDHV